MSYVDNLICLENSCLKNNDQRKECLLWLNAQIICWLKNLVIDWKSLLVLDLRTCLDFYDNIDWCSIPRVIVNIYAINLCRISRGRTDTVSHLSRVFAETSVWTDGQLLSMLLIPWKDLCDVDEEFFELFGYKYTNHNFILIFYVIFVESVYSVMLRNIFISKYDTEYKTIL